MLIRNIVTEKHVGIIFPAILSAHERWRLCSEIKGKYIECNRPEKMEKLNASPEITTDSLGEFQHFIKLGESEIILTVSGNEVIIWYEIFKRFVCVFSDSTRVISRLRGCPNHIHRIYLSESLDEGDKEEIESEWGEFFREHNVSIWNW